MYMVVANFNPFHLESWLVWLMIEILQIDIEFMTLLVYEETLGWFEILIYRYALIVKFRER